jgi:peptidoglycan/xylan/chitin deacetylase (PgdA/CDA1 family)
MPRVSSLAFVCLVAFALAASPRADAACKGQVYLTFDTGHMAPAEDIAAILRKHDVRATFFLANERTRRGDTSLDPAWAEFWRARAAEGHAFGNHTWRHWYFRRDVGPDKVAYVSVDGKTELLDQAAFCGEFKRVDDAFRQMTGRGLDPIWRAPGGRTTPRAVEFARACGYERHVHWAPAGFLGDELASEQHPNELLLKRALANIKAGDILMMHLGIWSRKDPYWPMLDPLLAGLKARGLCFSTLAAKGS